MVTPSPVIRLFIVVCVLIILYFTGYKLLVDDNPHQHREECRQQTRHSMSIPELGNHDFNGASYDDPDLVKYIQHYKMHPPATGLRKLSKPEVIDYSQFGQSTMLAEKIGFMKNGFFVEVGAHNGESFSNTLYFEKELNWTGLLIEADPSLFDILKTKNRNAFSINACVSLVPKCTDVFFTIKGFNGRINEGSDGTKVQCYPLYSLLQALGRNHIDLFSLDIEGDELKVLKTIPWDKMSITLLEVEVNHIKEGEAAVMKYMKSVGYTFVKKHKIDFLFARLDLLQKALNLE